MLDELAWEVMESDFSEENQARTITVLGRLCDGDDGSWRLTPRGFEDWPGRPADWLLRSRRELERFDWKPMGAGFYLRLTDGVVLDLSKSSVEAPDPGDAVARLSNNTSWVSDVVVMP